jgi:hypothetical protein
MAADAPIIIPPKPDSMGVNLEKCERPGENVWIFSPQNPDKMSKAPGGNGRNDRKIIGNMRETWENLSCFTICIELSRCFLMKIEGW